MKHLFYTLFITLGALFFSACGGAKLSPELQQHFDNKEKMYTTMNMYYNIARNGTKIVDATNYHSGILIPVNSEVTMQSVNAKQITFMYNGEPVLLRNIPRYTGTDIAGIVQRHFSKKKTDLSKFSKKEQKAIKAAKIFKGMSKDAVVLSLGLPPVHQTANLDANEWKYWRTKWTTFIVEFDKGKVVNVIGNNTDSLFLKD